MSHVGFLPDARKTLIYRVSGSSAPSEFSIRELGYPLKNFQITMPLKKAPGDLGDHMVGDLSSLDREGLFVATAGGERSVPFFIRKDCLAPHPAHRAELPPCATMRRAPSRTSTPPATSTTQ